MVNVFPQVHSTEPEPLGTFGVFKCCWTMQLKASVRVSSYWGWGLCIACSQYKLQLKAQLCSHVDATQGQRRTCFGSVSGFSERNNHSHCCCIASTPLTLGYNFWALVVDRRRVRKSPCVALTWTRIRPCCFYNHPVIVRHLWCASLSIAWIVMTCKLNLHVWAEFTSGSDHLTWWICPRGQRCEVFRHLCMKGWTSDSKRTEGGFMRFIAWVVLHSKPKRIVAHPR